MNDDCGPNQNDSEVKGINKVMDEDQAVNQSRRKLSTAGLIAVPLIMTLSSKSALGMNYRCTVSGMISGNLSHPGSIQQCMGSLPTYWYGTTLWPAPYAVSTLFHDVFAGSQFIHVVGGVTTSYTLFEVLDLTMGGTVANSMDPSYLGAHTVAALLNAHASDTGTSPFGSTEYGLTRNQVIALYNTYSATKPSELKALFEIWNQSDASTRQNYQTQISQLGLTIPNP